MVDDVEERNAWGSGSDAMRYVRNDARLIELQWLEWVRRATEGFAASDQGDVAQPWAIGHTLNRELCPQRARFFAEMVDNSRFKHVISRRRSEMTLHCDRRGTDGRDG